MASRSKDDLDPLMAEAYDTACYVYKQTYPDAPQPFLTCTHRPPEEQTLLYNQTHDGKDNNGNGIIDDKSEKVTWAKAWESPHNYMPSPAFDIAFINPLTQKLSWDIIYFRRFADIIRKVSPLVRWGGDWNDNGKTSDEKKPDGPHYERRDWKTLVKKPA